MKTRMPMHPFLFAAYFVLFLFARNVDEAPLPYVVRALVAVLICAALGLGIFWLIVRDRRKAAVLTTLLIVALFAYNPIHGLLGGVSIGGSEPFRHRFALPAYLLLTIAALFATARSRRDLRPLSKFLSVTGIILVSVTLLQIAQGFVRIHSYGDSQSQWAGVIAEELKLVDRQRWAGSKTKPDIYYIILDGHARQDVLRRDYGYADDSFVRQLRSKGFFIGDKSRSNYPYTYFSLPSSMNYDYVPSLINASGADRYSYRLQQEMIANSKVCRVLKAQGYQFAFLPSGFTVCVGSPYANIEPKRKWRYLTEFDCKLLDSSLLWPLGVSTKGSARRQLDTVEQLQDIARIEAPTFTFVHFACPHSPYIFRRDGTCPNAMQQANAEGGQAYLDQLIYTDQVMLRAIDTILARSSQPPIIILQADHGPNVVEWGFKKSQPRDPREKDRWLRDGNSAILNAYYFPGNAREKLYDTITPVNSFRVMFNEYFDARYPLLPDQVFYPKGNPSERANLQEALDLMVRPPYLDPGRKDQ